MGTVFSGLQNRHLLAQLKREGEALTRKEVKSPAPTEKRPADFTSFSTSLNRAVFLDRRIGDLVKLKKAEPK